MVDMPSKQEVFEALISVPAEIEVMYEDYEQITQKHMADLRTKGKTNAYWDDVKALSEKYGLEFTHPKYAAGLKSVETRPTVH